MMRCFIYLGIVLISAPCSATTVYVVSGTTWNVPGDFSSTNSVETIGGGGGGGNSSNGDVGGGGSGGCYSKQSNIPSLTGTLTIAVGAGGSHGDPAGTGGDTWFNGANLAASSVGAKGGQGGDSTTNAAACSTASGVGATK